MSNFFDNLGKWITAFTYILTLSPLKFTEIRVRLASCRTTLTLISHFCISPLRFDAVHIAESERVEKILAMIYRFTMKTLIYDATTSFAFVQANKRSGTF